jgi:hypothetical protein
MYLYLHAFNLTDPYREKEKIKEGAGAGAGTGTGMKRERPAERSKLISN